MIYGSLEHNVQYQVPSCSQSAPRIWSALIYNSRNENWTRWRMLGTSERNLVDKTLDNVAWRRQDEEEISSKINSLETPTPHEMEFDPIWVRLKDEIKIFAWRLSWCWIAIIITLLEKLNSQSSSSSSFAVDELISHTWENIDKPSRHSITSWEKYFAITIAVKERKSSIYCRITSWQRRRWERKALWEHKFRQENFPFAL